MDGSTSSSKCVQEKVLEDFRNAWKQEVKRKHHSHEQSNSSGKSSEKEKVDTTKEESIAELIEQTESLASSDKPPVTAMDHYVIAVDNERQGKLGKGKVASLG
jgi:hypothetical protein